MNFCTLACVFNCHLTMNLTQVIEIPSIAKCLQDVPRVLYMEGIEERTRILTSFQFLDIAVVVSMGLNNLLTVLQAAG